MERILRAAGAIWLMGMASVSVEAQASGEASVPVAVARPEVAAVGASYTFTGSITAERQSALSPRISGLVLKADLETGDVVTAGESVVSLDATLAEISLRQREVDLERARAEEAEAQRLLEEAERIGEGAFPRSTRKSLETALLLARVGVRQAEVAVAEQKEFVARHQVVAPFDGIVLRKRAEMGEWVQTGDPVIELVGRENLRMEVQLPQERIGVAMRTSKVEIRLPGLPDLMLAGTVEGIAPAVDPGTRSLRVRVALVDPPQGIKPGMSATAVFQPVADGSVLMIPRDAIIRSEDDQTYLWVVEQRSDGLRAAKREVMLGASRGDQFTVLTGLTAGDQVVVRGNENLRANQLLRIVETTVNRPLEVE